MIHFENAPLDEVACGVRFEGVQWRDIHFGLFYAEIEREYPDTQRRRPISPAVFDQNIPNRLAIQLLAEPDLPLLRYESPESPYLLQVQQDAFLLNWRRTAGKFSYPHFRSEIEGASGIWDRFVVEWQRFVNFCQKQKIGTPKILACHLNYINHMVQGELWNNPIDLSKWFRFLSWINDFESVSGLTLAIRFQSQGFPVGLNIRRAVRTTDQKSLFALDFFAAGRFPAETTLEEWFKNANEAIVSQFVEQTTEEAHQVWGLSHG